MPAEIQRNSIEDPETIRLLPQGPSADGAVAGATPLPEQGASDTDVYAPEAATGAHYVVLHAAPVNAQDETGAWHRRDLTPVAEPSGWTSTDGVSTVHYPRVLGSNAPVRFELTHGAVMIFPESQSPLPTPGNSDGRAVRYADALPDTDLAFIPTLGGFAETDTLGSQAAPGTLSYHVQATGGLQLSVRGSGGIEVRSGEGVVAVIPLGEAEDSANPPHTTTAQMSLTQTGGGGNYRLEVSLDPAFLASAVYPVRIDPGASTLLTLRDTYVDSGSPASSFENNAKLLTAGSGGTITRSSFLSFDTSTLQSSDAVVYSATLYAANEVGTSAIDARQVTAAWPTTLTWNNQPGVGSRTFDSFAGSQNTTWQWNLSDLYQHYLDQSSTDYGIRLSGNNDHRFFSSDNTSGKPDPQLVVSFDRLPPPPVLAGPADGEEFDAPEPLLRIEALPVDPDGDDVLVDYQISTSSTDFSTPIWESGWTDATSVPALDAPLADGTTYYWRALSADVCQQPDTLCSTQGSDGVSEARRASETGRGTPVTSMLGDDPRRAYWSQALGNGMTLKVNETTGNLFLDLPFDAPTGQPDRHAGGLIKARTVATSPAAGNRGFEYSLGAATGGVPNLLSVTDTLDRQLAFEWSGGALNRVKTDWDTPDRVWDFTYGSGGKLLSVVNPAGEVVSFDYNDAGMLKSISDGQATADAAPGWTITYTSETSCATTVCRVHTVKAPGADDPWQFDYSATNAKGALAGVVKITDPRGVATVGDPSDQNDPLNSDFETMVESDLQGFPVRISGPRVSDGNGGTFWPKTTMRWDTNGNRLCVRTPAANRIAEKCRDANLTDDGLSERYGYDKIAPYPRTKLVRSAPAPSQDTSVETYGYDASPSGTPYQNLWAEYYDNDTLTGIPDQEGLWSGALDASWSAGGPPLGGDDAWSIRWSGILDVPPINGTEYHLRKYAFKLWSRAEDGASLFVENQVLLANCTGGGTNFRACPTATVRLWPGRHPITIEYRNVSGVNAAAQFKLEWDAGGGGSFSLLPIDELTPHLLLLTNDVVSRSTLADIEDPDAYEGITKTDFTFPADSDKARALPQDVTVTDLKPGGTSRTTTYAYDEFGRPTSSTAPLGRTTTYDYEVGSDHPERPCLRKLTTPFGAVTKHECNEDGDVTKQSVVVRASDGQGAQTRVTDMRYDALGRLKELDPQGEPITKTDFDKAGRTTSVDELIDADANLHAVTTYVYDLQGRLKEEHLPNNQSSDPANTDPGPVIKHFYDEVGNETKTRKMSDVAEHDWLASYDALGRPSSTTTPTGESTTSTYGLYMDGSALVNDVAVTDPAGVTLTTASDLLGRTVSEQVGSLEPTTYEYDVVDNRTKQTDPAGVWTEDDFNGFGEVTEERTRYLSGDPATTTYEYDAAGRLHVLDGPRSVTDTITYGYDDDDRLKQATLDGLSGNKTFSILYDDAGERVRVSEPMSTASASVADMVRHYTYDDYGLLDAATDGLGHVTTNHYDAAGWLTSVDDPRGLTLRYAYDRWGERTRRHAVVNATGATQDSETYTYDTAGMLKTATNPQAAVEITYDEDNRLDTVHESVGGALANESQTDYAYLDGRLDTLTTTLGSTSNTTTYGYDANGLLQTLHDPLSGNDTTYS
ncbi:MAG: DNRLRE domain-containing protein, partial [Actinomycetota bacterium]